MIQKFLHWWQHRHDKDTVMVAVLCAMTKQLGGTVVLTMTELRDAHDISIVPNDDPEGIRVTVREI